MVDYSSSPYYSTAVSAANQWGVPADLFVQQIGQESGFNPDAVNASSGATGIAQFLPSTAANAGYGIAPFDPTDPVASLNAAAQYDKSLYQQTGSWAGALSAYGTGTGGSGVSSVLDELSGSGLYTLMPNLQPGSSGNGILGGNALNSLGDAVGLGTSSGGPAISIIEAGKRVGLFVVAIVLIGVGVWALASSEQRNAIARAVG
jgi:hypothetical protein